MPKFPATTITWRAVASSNVAAVGWDHGSRLYIQFKSSAVYLYEGVSRQRAVACAGSNSVGKYLDKKIKPHFKATKVIAGLRVQL
jgi:hypothetical protein